MRDPEVIVMLQTVVVEVSTRVPVPVNALLQVVFAAFAGTDCRREKNKPRERKVATVFNSFFTSGS